MAFGRLHSINPRIPTRTLLVLNAAFVSVLLTLCFSVALYQPVNRIAWPAIVVPTVVFALWIFRFLKRLSLWTLVPTLAILMLAVALVSGRAILNQDFVSPYPDAWAYCSFAEYLGHNSLQCFLTYHRSNNLDA